MALFGGKRDKAAGADEKKLPRHIAIIMDGNGRWAKRRGLPRTAGHKAGTEMFRTVAYHCRDIGIEYLTVYAFSTENWKRPRDEVSVIMGLMEDYLREAIEKMERDGVRLRVVGDLAGLPESIQRLEKITREKSTHIEKGLIVNLCVNYGGRADIISAAKAYADDYKAGRAPELTDETFSSYTAFAGVPDPDLIIRTSGEIRLSNFLLWQCAYAEMYFTDTLWPDFTPAELDKAIEEYIKRQRRYGAV